MSDNDARAYLEKSIDNVEDLPGDLPWTNAEVLEMLREAVGLFEKAHTPTDDEREAQKRIEAGLEYIDRHWLAPFRPGETGHDLREILAGSRRTEVPEPSAGHHVDHHDDVKPQGEPSDAHLRGHWSNGDPVHIITDGVDRWIAPNHNGATWIEDAS